MERLLGHIVFVGLCRRESLAILGSAYRFAQRGFGRAPVASWGGTVVVADASPWGLGAARAEAPLAA
eukprot:2960027-Alexandrium_andersonii.AAC.1